MCMCTVHVYCVLCMCMVSCMQPPTSTLVLTPTPQLPRPTTSRYLGPHCSYILREYRIVGYAQFLEPYKSVLLSSMADRCHTTPHHHLLSYVVIPLSP